MQEISDDVSKKKTVMLSLREMSLELQRQQVKHISVDTLASMWDKICENLVGKLVKKTDISVSLISVTVT